MCRFALAAFGHRLLDFSETNMKIGITCYPTYGGSGVVATELGIGTRGARSRSPFHQLCDAHSAEFHLRTHLFSRGRGHILSALRPSAIYLGASDQNERGSGASLARPAARSLRDPALRERAAGALDGAPKKLPFITTLHGTDITLVGNNRSYLPITRFSIEQSDGVTSISQYLRERTIREFEIKRPIEVIPNFVNCDLYKRCDDQSGRKQWAKNGEPILMHLSNFRPVKRITDVVEIFALVREKIPAKLVMMGDGPDRGAAEYIVRKKHLSKDVFFHGQARSRPGKTGPRRSVSAASDEESFGLAALEAMACEVPVIATNVGGLPELVTNGADGYLIPPRDIAAGARYALEILARPDRGRAMGQQARVNAKRNTARMT